MLVSYSLISEIVNIQVQQNTNSDLKTKYLFTSVHIISFSDSTLYNHPT